MAATKNICCAKGTVDYWRVTRYFEKFCSGYKNMDDQRKSGRPKTVDSKTMLQARVANPVTQWVSGNLNILLSSVVYPLHNPSKNIWSCCVKKCLDSFKNVIYKTCLKIIYIYLTYMNKQDLAFNNQQWLICHKTKPKQTKLYIPYDRSY